MALSQVDQYKITNQQDRDYLTTAQDGWQKANAAGDENLKKFWASEGAKVRAKYGYSGGADGNTYTELPTTFSNTAYQTNPSNAGLMRTDTTSYANLANAMANHNIANNTRDYIQNLTNISNSYNQSRTDLYKTGTDIWNQYLNEVSDRYKDAYLANALATQNAANRGLTSSALGTAMNTSNLVSAANKVSDLKNNKDKSLSDVAVNLDRLAADYNINRDSLLQNLYNQNQSAISEAQSNYLDMLGTINQNYTSAYNNYLMSGYDAATNGMQQANAAQIQADADTRNLQLQLAAQEKQDAANNAQEQWKLQFLADHGALSS